MRPPPLWFRAFFLLLAGVGCLLAIFAGAGAGADLGGTQGQAVGAAVGTAVGALVAWGAFLRS